MSQSSTNDLENQHVFHQVEHSSDLSRMKKARAVVDGHGVKLHKFLPSGRTIWTVIGSDSELFVDFDPGDDSKLYCACSDFYFRVLSNKISECYHLLACKIAQKEEMYVVINFSDDEFPQFLRALVSDNLRSISARTTAKEEPLP